MSEESPTLTAAERRRQKLLARQSKVESGQTIGSQSLEEVKKEKQEVVEKIQSEEQSTKVSAKEELIQTAKENSGPKISYGTIVALQNNRQRWIGLSLIARTIVAIIFGFFCHLSYSTEVRLQPYADICQKFFSLSTFVVIDVFLLWFSWNQEKEYDTDIKVSSPINDFDP